MAQRTHRGAVHFRVHVYDVGPDCHVDGYGQVASGSGGKDARVRMRGSFHEQRLADRSSKPFTALVICLQNSPVNEFRQFHAPFRTRRCQDAPQHLPRSSPPGRFPRRELFPRRSWLSLTEGPARLH